MDRRQKSTLRKYQLKLAEELILDEDFYAALRQTKLFNQHMIATIRAKTTDLERVHTMLELLTKRGPEAFDKFVGLLRENFSWLADMLVNGYTELCHAQQTHSNNDDAQTSPKVIDDSFEESNKCTKLRQTYSAQYSQHSATTIQCGQQSPQYVQQPVMPWNNLCLSLNFSFQNDIDGQIPTYHANETRRYTDGSEITDSTCGSPRKTVNVQIKPPPVHPQVNSSTHPPHPVYSQESHTTHPQQETVHHSLNDTGTESDTFEEDNDVFDGRPTITTHNPAVASKNCTETNHRKTYNKDLSSDEEDQQKESISGPNYCDTKRTPADGQIMEEQDKVPNTDTPYSWVSKKRTNSTPDKQNILMREMYMKMKNFIEENKNIDKMEKFSGDTSDTECEFDVSLEMLDDLIDEITDMPFTEHTMMIEKSYKLIRKRDHKPPLDICIQELIDQIHDFEIKLNEEVKKSNKMVDDMYKLSEEKKNLDRIKTRMHKLEEEKLQLRDKLKEMEITKERNDILLEKIDELEAENKNLKRFKTQMEMYESECKKEEKRYGNGRRLGTGAKKVSLAQTSRRPGVYPSSDLRLLSVKTSSPLKNRGHFTTTRQKRP